MGITVADEWMCHQTVSTFDHVENSDPQWTERVWLAAFEKTGKFVFAFGMGKYTNRNVMDASLSIAVDNRKQYNLRASRALFPDIETYTVGPMSYEIPEPLKSVRVVVDQNDHGIRCDLRFVGETEIYEQTPSMFRRRNGRLVNHMIRYFQTGSVEGWIEVEGVRHEVKREDWWASRDRSWGLRSNTGELVTADGVSSNLLGGMQPPGDGVPYRWCYFTMQFPNWNTSFEFAQTPDNQRLGPALGHLQHAPHTGRKNQKIIHVDHHWDFMPGSTFRLRGIRSVIHLDDKTTREIVMKPIGLCLRRPGGGCYGGYQGWAQGLWKGPLWVDGDTTDLTDEDLVRKLHFTDDYALKVTSGDEHGWGLTEPLIPGIAELLTT
jgi:predicted transcriptional regulator